MPTSGGPDRDWSAAREKVDREGACRAANLHEGPCEGALEAAHIGWRRLDTRGNGGRLVVLSVRIVPLCTKAHRLYDAHELDLTSVLFPSECSQLVLDVGLVTAVRRISGKGPDELALEPVPAPITHEDLVPF